ncbi:MAG: ATP synthase F0 subunit C [Clostridiaceae bacterium]|nr:ATP synthase F0 subunit C [Clostridiaceae bacterium]
MDNGIIALGAALAIGLVGACAALGISMATGKALESTARQPEMAGRIQSMLMIAIVFIESVAIYALVISLLLIFAFK